MVDPNNAVFPPKTAVSSFPIAGWEHARRAEVVTESDGRAMESDVERDENRGEGQGRQKGTTSGPEGVTAYADEWGS